MRTLKTVAHVALGLVLGMLLTIPPFLPAGHAVPPGDAGFSATDCATWVAGNYGTGNGPARTTLEPSQDLNGLDYVLGLGSLEEQALAEIGPITTWDQLTAVRGFGEKSVGIVYCLGFDLL